MSLGPTHPYLQCSAIARQTGEPVSDRDLVIICKRFCGGDLREAATASAVGSE
jgi:hypothetical protein